MRRCGLSLLEVIVATAIFSGMVVMLMESMLNMRNMAHTVDDVDILEEQADAAERVIRRDFSNSGWFYCRAGANGRKFYPQIHLADKKTWQPLAISPPHTVTVPRYDPVTKTMVDDIETASVTQNQATIYGDAIFFTRLQPEGQPLSIGPAAYSSSIIDFETANPVRLDAYANAPAIRGLILNPDAPDVSELTSVVWETTPDSVGTTVPDLYDDTKVRLFAYRVIPDPKTGRGNLVRFYSNPGGNRDSADRWIEDVVIATDVVGMRIYSYEMAAWYSGSDADRDFSDNEAAGLTNNQIRFVIDFARNLTHRTSGTAIDVDNRSTTAVEVDGTRSGTIKTLNFTVGLRSITNSSDQ